MSRRCEERAAEFDRQNPIVFDTLKSLAVDRVRAGRRRLGIAMLWERMRWELEVESTESAPKFNNNHRAYFARKLMAEVPELAGVFKTRGGSVGIADGIAATLDEPQQKKAA